MQLKKEPENLIKIESTSVSGDIRPINLILSRFAPESLVESNLSLSAEEVLLLVSEWPDDLREAFEERAAIMEYDSGLSRSEANLKAYADLLQFRSE